MEEFFEDGRVTFGEFKEFYLDHTQRTQQQRSRVVTERLESTPRGRAAKKKWQSKVHTLNAVRLLGRNSIASAVGGVQQAAGAVDEDEHEEEVEVEEPDRRTSVKLTGTETRKDKNGKEYTVFIIACKRFDGTTVYPEPKRFSEFFALRAQLIKAGRSGIEKVPFPPRKVRRSASSSQSTVEHRQAGLETWLNEILYQYANDPFIADFVAVRSKSFWKAVLLDDDDDDDWKAEEGGDSEKQSPVPSSGGGGGGGGGVAAASNLLLTLRASIKEQEQEQQVEAEEEEEEADHGDTGLPRDASVTEGTPPTRSPGSTTPPPRHP